MKKALAEQMESVSGADLTVIIPVYDRQDELDRALDSLLAQDMSFRVIVVDDASPKAMVIRSRFSSGLSIDLVRCEANRGAAQARNIGLDRSRTSWITFLDSDDSLVPNTLSARWTSVITDQDDVPDEMVIYGCGWNDVDETGERLATRYPLPGTSASDFASGCWFCPGSCVILNRKAVLAAVGYQSAQLRRLEDYEWFLRLGLSGFVLKPQKIIGANIERKRQVNLQLVTDSVDKILKKFPRQRLTVNLRRRMQAYLSLEIAAAQYFSGMRWRAVVWIAKSIFHLPRARLHLSPGWRFEK